MSYAQCTLASPTSLVFAQAPATTAKPTASQDNTVTGDAGFVADSGGTEQTSGELLLIEAYAVIWVLVFAMIFMSMRSQRKLDDRITQLSADLDKARAADAKREAG